MWLLLSQYWWSWTSYFESHLNSVPLVVCLLVPNYKDIMKWATLMIFEAPGAFEQRPGDLSPSWCRALAVPRPVLPTLYRTEATQRLVARELIPHSLPQHCYILPVIFKTGPSSHLVVSPGGAQPTQRVIRDACLPSPPREAASTRTHPHFPDSVPARWGLHTLSPTAISPRLVDSLHAYLMLKIAAGFIAHSGVVSPVVRVLPSHSPVWQR